MKRRTFLTLMAGAAAAWPLPSYPQTNAPVIGLLSGTDRADGPLTAIAQGLKESGLTVGRNVTIERRWADGQFDRLPALVNELVARRVAAIVAIQNARAPLAAKDATKTVPIVFAIGGDPVRLGLVNSMRRPGGNVTGTNFLVNPLGAKRLEMLREMMPKAAKIGLLVNPRSPGAMAETKDLQDAARQFGLQVHVQQAADEREIEAAFVRFAEQRIDALTFAADAMFNAERGRIVALAAHHRLPAMYFLRDFVEAGGLTSYSGSPGDAYRLAGAYAGRILKGEKPADLPVQQSTKLELVVNLKTAKVLGIELPRTLMARADEVIE